jgi:hypothetical protein
MINWAVAQIDLAELAHQAGPIGLVGLGSNPPARSDRGSDRPRSSPSHPEPLRSPSLAPDPFPCRLHRRLQIPASPGHPGCRRWSQKDRRLWIYPRHHFDFPGTSSGGCPYPHLRLGFQSSDVTVVRRCSGRLRSIRRRVLVRCSPRTCAGVARRGGCRGAPCAATDAGRRLRPTHAPLAVLTWCSAAAAAATTLRR